MVVRKDIEMIDNKRHKVVELWIVLKITNPHMIRKIRHSGKFEAEDLENQKNKRRVNQTDVFAPVLLGIWASFYFTASSLPIPTVCAAHSMFLLYL